MIVKGPLSVTVSPRWLVVAQPMVKVMKINIISVFMLFLLCLSLNIRG